MRIMFQPTPAHGGRRSGADDMIEMYSGFNPRLRTAGDLHTCYGETHIDIPFQPTPAHGGRRPLLTWCLSNAVVSTHARARRATGVSVENHRAADVSTHARARRATSIGFTCMSSFRCFNPRPRTAGDPTVRAIIVLDFRVSTHARARRATGQSDRGQRKNGGFNPRPRTAGDTPNGSPK